LSRINNKPNYSSIYIYFQFLSDAWQSQAYRKIGGQPRATAQFLSDAWQSQAYRKIGGQPRATAQFFY